MEYTSQEESRIIGIMEDFCKPANRHYLEGLGLYYGTLDDSSMSTPEQAVKFFEDFDKEPMGEEDKRRLVPYRFRSNYLRALGTEGDRALIMAELILQAEKKGFQYQLVNCDSARIGCLRNILAHRDYKTRLKNNMQSNRGYAEMTLSCMTEEMIAAEQNPTLAREMRSARKYAKKMLAAKYKTEPFAWLERSSEAGRRLDIFGIKTLDESCYNYIYLADSAKPKILTFGDMPGVYEEEQIMKFARGLS